MLFRSLLVQSCITLCRKKTSAQLVQSKHSGLHGREPYSTINLTKPRRSTNRLPVTTLRHVAALLRNKRINAAKVKGENLVPAKDFGGFIENVNVYRSRTSKGIGNAMTPTNSIRDRLRLLDKKPEADYGDLQGSATNQLIQVAIGLTQPPPIKSSLAGRQSLTKPSLQAARFVLSRYTDSRHNVPETNR